MAGECIVVTGGAGSLGAALVRELCARGYRVAIVESDHAAAHANDLAKSTDGKAIAIISDVASTPAWIAALKEIERQIGPATGAALIAGGWAGGKFLHEGGDDDTWHAMIEGNIETAYRSIRALVPGMVTRKNGSIVVIGSRAVERPWTSTKAAAYAATKSAAVTPPIQSVSDGTTSQTQSVQLTDPTNPVDAPVQTSIFTFHQVTTGVPGGVAAKVEITSAGGFKTDFSTPATCS